MEIFLNVIGRLSIFSVVCCNTIILVKMVEIAGKRQALIAYLFLSLYAYVWGWFHADSENLTIVMIIWTLAFILSIYTNYG